MRWVITGEYNFLDFCKDNANALLHLTASPFILVALLPIVDIYIYAVYVATTKHKIIKGP